MQSTLLAAIWNAEGNAEEVTEQVTTALESGDLELTGNFRDWRNDNPAGFWRKDDENAHH